MKKIADFTNDTPLLPNAVQPAQLRVQIWQDEDDGHAIVLISQTNDNPGASVTNTAEHMATLIINRYDLRHHATTWIEHYPTEYHKASPTKLFMQETFDTIQFSWHFDYHVGKWIARNPEWQRIERRQIDEWIGQALTELETWP